MKIKEPKSQLTKNQKHMPLTKKNTANEGNAREENTNVVRPELLDSDLISVTKPVKKKEGGKINAYLLHNNETFLTETPWLTTPFGVTSYVPEDKDGKEKGSKQWSINLGPSMQASSATVESGEKKSPMNEDDKEAEVYFNKWRAIDDIMIEHGVEYAEDIKLNLGLRKGDKSPKEVIAKIVSALYGRAVGDDPNDKYPPKIKPKIFARRDKKADDKSGSSENEVPDIKLFILDKDDEIQEQKLKNFDDLVSKVPRGSKVKAILQPKIWYVAGKYGLTFYVVQLLVKPRTSLRPTEFAFHGVTKKMKNLSTDEKQVDSDKESENQGENQGEENSENNGEEGNRENGSEEGENNDEGSGEGSGEDGGEEVDEE